MKTQWKRWLVASAALAAFSFGFVNQGKADEFLNAKKGYGPVPEDVPVVKTEREEPVTNAREITFTASPNPYRYRTFRRYRPVFVQPYYYGYSPYGGYSPYFVPSGTAGWPALPPPFSYDTFHPFLGY